MVTEPNKKKLKFSSGKPGECTAERRVQKFPEDLYSTISALF